MIPKIDATFRASGSGVDTLNVLLRRAFPGAPRPAWRKSRPPQSVAAIATAAAAITAKAAQPNAFSRQPIT